MHPPSLLQRLRERKLVQWALAYLAGAWVLFEVSDAVGGHLGWPEVLYRAFLVLLAIGFLVTLVLAWYHGEKGRQRVSGPELLMITVLLLICGGVLYMVRRESQVVEPIDQPAGDMAESDATTLNQLPGIAVLPFANRSDLSSDQYFADGIQDELLTRLQRVPGLRVISRTSSETYRATQLTIPEIGGELGVGYVLEGGVQRAGDQVRITVQLIDAVNDNHLWANTYDQVLTPENLFSIQSEIVGTVAGTLNIELREEERLRAARRSTTDPEALDLYLRGIAEDEADAVPLLEAAIERDPRFVGAHAALAVRLARQYQMGLQRSEEIAATARRAAERAA
jgi:TolB-like protein